MKHIPRNLVTGEGFDFDSIYFSMRFAFITMKTSL